MISRLRSKLACHLMILTGVALTTLFVGCGGGETGPKTYHVTGKVTFDGEPVETGRIQFRSAGAGKAFSGEIKNGEYSLDAEAGEMTVSIEASRIIPGKFDTSNPDEDPQPVGEMYIPEKYNSRTELSASVKEGGDNTIPFDLTSK